MINYGQYEALTFGDVFPTKDEFLSVYDAADYFPKTITDANAGILWALLTAEYKNSPIASTDDGRFILQVMKLIYVEGPIWEKRLNLQIELRGLTSDQMVAAATSKVVQNRADNPSSYVASGTSEDSFLLEQINTQTSQISKASKMSAIASLNMLLADVTTPFIEKFKPLFRTIVIYDEPRLYGDVD